MSIYEKLWAIPEDTRNKIREWGDKLQVYIPVITLGFCACMMTNQFSIWYVIYFALCMLMMVLIKALFNNPRPREIEGSEDPDDNPDLDLEWSPTEGQSFLSGHSSSASAGAWVAFSINPWLGVVLLVLALFVGFSRIVAKAHWIRDVVCAFIMTGAIWWIFLEYLVVV